MCTAVRHATESRSKDHRNDQHHLPSLSRVQRGGHGKNGRRRYLLLLQRPRNRSQGRNRVPRPRVRQDQSSDLVEWPDHRYENRRSLLHGERLETVVRRNAQPENGEVNKSAEQSGNKSRSQPESVCSHSPQPFVYESS